MNLLPTSSLLPPAGSCDRMLGVHAHEALSSPPSLDSYTGDAVRCDWRLALLASAVCLLARTPSRTPSRTLHRTRAHAAARIHARACPCLHAQRRIRTQHLSHTTHLCAMRTCTCTQPDRPLHTQRRDITGKTHPDTHMHTHAKHVRTHSCLHTHIHT
jgi:hypothetical protein